VPYHDCYLTRVRRSLKDGRKYTNLSRQFINKNTFANIPKLNLDFNKTWFSVQGTVYNVHFVYKAWSTGPTSAIIYSHSQNTILKQIRFKREALCNNLVVTKTASNMFMRRPIGYKKWGQIKNVFHGLYEWFTPLNCVFKLKQFFELLYTSHPTSTFTSNWHRHQRRRVKISEVHRMKKIKRYSCTS
jgi:hypothetical protein